MSDTFKNYDVPRTGGSLSRKGFDCRFCSCLFDTSHHGPGDRIMYAASFATEHMNQVHRMTMDGKPLETPPPSVPVQLDIFDVLGATA